MQIISCAAFEFDNQVFPFPHERQGSNVFFVTTEISRSIGEELVTFALDRFGSAGLAADNLAMTLLLHPMPLSRTEQVAPISPEGFAYSGSRPFYPCSVVKMFYLAAVQAAIEAGSVQEHNELSRAMRDMILWSSNTATNYIIDIVTGTTGDTLLAEPAFATWVERRNAVNRYFQSLKRDEFDGINVCQKLMDDERYGREKVFVTIDGNNHNRLTTNASAYLMHEIMARRMISADASQRMAEFLARPVDPDFAARPASQISGYIGAGLPADAKLWSKAGWTGWTGDADASYRRHDAAYVELSAGVAFTLVVFTEGKAISQNSDILPSIGKLACECVSRSL
jgi:beta-lactamase class A